MHFESQSYPKSFMVYNLLEGTSQTILAYLIQMDLFLGDRKDQ